MCDQVLFLRFELFVKVMKLLLVNYWNIFCCNRIKNNIHKMAVGLCFTFFKRYWMFKDEKVWGFKVIFDLRKQKYSKKIVNLQTLSCFCIRISTNRHAKCSFLQYLNYLYIRLFTYLLTLRQNDDNVSNGNNYKVHACTVSMITTILFIICGICCFSDGCSESRNSHDCGNNDDTKNDPA